MLFLLLPLHLSLQEIGLKNLIQIAFDVSVSVVNMNKFTELNNPIMNYCVLIHSETKTLIWTNNLVDSPRINLNFLL